MKYLLSFALLFILSVVHAQEANFKSRPITDVTKNETIVINDLIFDYRILKHYSEKSLQDMPISKLNQIHFLYTESYTVLDAEKCPNLKNIDIDIAKIEIYRKENEDALIDYGTNCKVQVKLISKKALKEKFNSFK